MTTEPGRNFKADAIELVKEAKEFTSTGSQEAAEKFSKQWLSVALTATNIACKSKDGRKLKPVQV